MRKLLIALVVVLLVLLAGLYFFIPDTLTVATGAKLPGTVAGAHRTLLQKENWKQFWEGGVELTPTDDFTENDLFIKDRDTFRIVQVLQNAFTIAISNGNETVKSTLLTLPVQRDSVVLNWTYSKPASANPFTRLQQYRQAVATRKNMEATLQNMSDFLGSYQHIYGIDIAQTSIKDTMLVSTFVITNHYPATADIYALVKKLQVYIAANGAQQTGSPLLNITPLDAQQYKMMVALPTSVPLPGKGDIAYKRMIPGRFLVTTVNGGGAAIDNAYQKMQEYFRDYQRVAMAIPFQVLVTDRLQQPDTTQWVTKLYFPVM